MRLYMVKAAESDYDEFSAGVVYANSPDDAIALVRKECRDNRPYTEDTAPGAWYPIRATLTATPVERKRGAVLGHGVAG